MPDIEIREIPDWVVQFFRGAAEHAGHSLEEELRRALTEVAERRRAELLSDLQEFHERLRQEIGELPDSTSEIRADREAHG